ncbi:MAG: glycosyltransferase [Planctomycetota bacterium]|nr:MAG: glycosyltransferase [Planctomycetota bacterium]REK17636.1 MAG: glycosyltransferase [Planctomycetota bacterium]
MNATTTTPNERPADALLSVVLPVYNEREVLEELLGRVGTAAAACGSRYEIVLVNDGSHDGSGELLDELAAGDRHLRVIHLSRNFGHQAAVQAGLVAAQGDAIVMMDSDLQDAPEAIPQFYAEWQAGTDVVFAVRTKRKENVIKRLLFAGFHRLLSRVATTPIPADAGIFGLVDARVKREIVALAERDRYLPGLRSWVGFRQRGVVVERLARYDGRPRVSLAGLWRLAKTAVFGFSSFPLFVFHVIGFAALFVFVTLSSYALFCKLFTDLAIPGWTSHVLSASFFGALNALGISILGEYVIRIYDQVRGRPLYLVSRTVNVSPAHAIAAPTGTPANVAPGAAAPLVSITPSQDVASQQEALLHEEAERFYDAICPPLDSPTIFTVADPRD